jgi:hypothetical protein
MSDRGIDQGVPDQNNHRSWVLVAAWFGTIVFVGLLKRVLERQRPF